MNPHAVLFDLDGTLLDTLEDLADSMNAVLARHGLSAHPLEAYRYFVGDGVINLVRRALGGPGRDDECVHRLVAEMREQYARRWDRKTRPYEGIPPLLDALTARRSPKAVLSNKPHDATALCVGKLLGRWRFDAVQGVTDEVPPKPDPTGAMGVCRRLGAPPEAFVYVGDTNTDMRTARAAGMCAVGALWGFRTAEELSRSGAQSLIARPLDLLDLL